MERKTVSLAEFKIDGSTGEFSGYGSIFGNLDGGGDIVMPGAFTKALPAFLRDGFISWSHDWGQPIAYPTDAREDKTGLLLTGSFHSTPEAQRARTIAAERLAAGKRMGLSIGYAVEEEEWGPKGRSLKVINPLFEVGFVTVPMNREANLGSVKTGDQDQDADPVSGLAAAVARFLGDGGSLTAQLTAMRELREKEGRSLSEANQARIAEMLKAVQSLAGDLTSLDAAANAGAKGLTTDLDALLEEARFLGVVIPAPQQ